MSLLNLKTVLLNLVLLDTVYRQACAAATCKAEFSSRFGLITYNKNRDGWNKCDWIFNYNDSSNAVVLVIKFQKRSRLYNIKSVTLPDGTILTRNTLSSRFSWCEAYVKKSGSCLKNVTYPSICDKAAVSIETWPPKITTKVYYYSTKVYHYSMEVAYSFFDCSKSTTATTTTTRKLTTSTTLKSTPTENVKKPTENNSKNAQESIGRSMSVATGVLATLLLIAVGASVVVAVKYRKLKLRNPANNQPAANGNGRSVDYNVYTMATAPSQSNNPAANGQREMVDNELYTM